MHLLYNTGLCNNQYLKYIFMGAEKNKLSAISYQLSAIS